MTQRKDTLEMVREFHEKFSLPILDQGSMPSDDRKLLRLELLYEELNELENGLNLKNYDCDQDIVAVLDALCDLQYVLDGAFLELGLHGLKNNAMAEVHRSNMSKLGANGKPIYSKTGKVLKGPNYTPPDLVGICRNAGILKEEKSECAA
ncbi:MAG: nucleoside triphosphate pyrophosphohydrolase family protein [Candidatus Dadabacteria bacterium]|nr:nucleoside triphosphate pyrophosphohydrolase family protein [Candidatus Dadabacteria bacterium]